MIRSTKKRRTKIKKYKFNVIKRPLRLKEIKKPIRIKQPIKISSPVEVEADRLDIRSLNPYRDRAQMYGTDGSSALPILTDSEGRLIVANAASSSTRQYIETRFTNIDAVDHWTRLPSQDISRLIVYTYVALNQGAEPARVKVELSPDNVHYQLHREIVVTPSELRIIVPAYFLRYARIAVKAENDNAPSVVDIYFQAQQ